MDPKIAVTAFLNTERNSVFLSPVLVEALVVYIVDLNGMDVDDVSDVNESFIEYAEEAYTIAKTAEMPKMLADRVRAWVGVPASPPGTLPAAAHGKKAVVSGADEKIIFGEAEPRDADLVEYRNEMDNQGLSGVQMLVLSLALELGRVVAPGTFLGEYVWGAAPAMSSLARLQKKAGVETLTQILQDKERRSVRPRLVAFFGSITRGFSELGELTTATRIARFWSDTSTVSANDEVMCAYLKEWMRKYGGRGIPELVDLKIATRVAGEQAGIGGLSEQDRKELKEAKEEAKLAKQEAASARNEIRQARQAMERINQKGGGPPPPGKGTGKGNPAGGGGKGKCFICGEEGHQVGDCPYNSFAKGADAKKDDEDK